MARIMVGKSTPPKNDKPIPYAGVEGRMYLPSSDPDAGKTKAQKKAERKAAKKAEADEAARLAAQQKQDEENAKLARANADQADQASKGTVEAAKENAGDPPPPAAEPPSGNASRDDWAEYAKSQGATDEDLDGLGRNEIRAKYQSDLI